MDAAITSAPRGVGYYGETKKVPIQTGEVTRRASIEHNPVF